MKDSLIFAAMSAQSIALAVALYWVDHMHRRETLYYWASGHGLNLLTARHPLVSEWRAIPMSPGKSPHIVRVHVETKEGNRRSGWVRLDSSRPGPSSPEACVKWDEV